MDIFPLSIQYLLENSRRLFNLNIPSSQENNFHYKDKMIMRPSYFNNENLYTWKDVLCIENWSMVSIQCRYDAFSSIFAKHTNHKAAPTLILGWLFNTGPVLAFRYCHCLRPRSAMAGMAVGSLILSQPILAVKTPLEFWINIPSYEIDWYEHSLFILLSFYHFSYSWSNVTSKAVENNGLMALIRPLLALPWPEWGCGGS